MNLEGFLEIVQVSSTGMVRAHNEDSTAFDLQLGVAVVADGMGGYRGGEVASAIAVTQIIQRLQVELSDFYHGQTDEDSGYSYESLLMREVLGTANKAIFDTAQEQPEYRGMGTTVVSMLFYDNKVSIAHVGDSRAYLYRSQALHQLTNDHTVRQELIDKGYYTPEEADRTVSRNLVTRALGIDSHVDVDVCEEAVLPGDVYLLCSDGLNDMVEDRIIERCMSKATDDLLSIAQQLVDHANHNGGTDNISAMLVRVDQAFPITKSWQSKLVDWFN